MTTRKQPLAISEIYHVFTKSIAGYEIFTEDCDFSRIIKTINYYLIKNPPLKFSRFIEEYKTPASFLDITNKENERIVKIIAYCIMPTHMHMIVQQIENNGISTFMRKLLNSYSKYFNIKNSRKGPLWENRFRNVLVEKDEQLLHLTRYIHLNPVTAYLVEKPEYWKYSSYHEYIGFDYPESNKKICEFEEFLEIKPLPYKEFVNTRIDDQREFARIKNLLLE